MNKRKPFLAVTLITLTLAAGQSTASASMNLSFQRTWGGFNDEHAEGVAVAPDGSVYVAGGTNSFGTGVGVGDRDAFLLKYTPGGGLAWQKTYGVGRSDPLIAADDVATDVAVGADGAVYVTGFTTTGHAFLVRFDPAGNLLWQRAWGSDGFELPDAVAVARTAASTLPGSRTASARATRTPSS